MYLSTWSLRRPCPAEPARSGLEGGPRPLTCIVGEGPRPPVAGAGSIRPSESELLELTPDQLRAAEACGCVFLPATDEQIGRLSMQRRVFRIGGQPFVATRDGGSFFETHATLLPLIGGHAPGGERGSGESGESAREAAAADAVAAAEIATEQHAARGGAQVVRSRAAGRPRVPPRGGGKRGV